MAITAITRISQTFADTTLLGIAAILRLIETIGVYKLF